ncbi:pali-domain-containing protein [Meredithblackwellia eburnea MCA 4105]
MAGCLGFHHIGTFLLLVACIFLVVSSITAPVVGDLALLKITLTNTSALRNSSVTFGVWGHCVLDVAPAATDQDWCSAKGLGYSIGDIVGNTTGVAYSTPRLDSLTTALVLHPVVAGITFLSFLIAAISHRIGFIVSALVATFSWFLSVAMIAVDFVIFLSVKHHISTDGGGSTAAFGTALWLGVAAVPVLFLGTFATFFSCLSDSKYKRERSY